MYYIRTDANKTIGTGHMMRCLSIAEELRRRGEIVIFIVADENSEIFAKSKDFKVICLYSVWNDLEQELESLIRVIKANDISALLVDSYYVTELYLKTVRQHTRIVYIDDLNAFIYPVDLLINYNIYADESNYAVRYKEAGINTQFLMGPEYAPLRHEFTDIRKEIKQSVSRILVTSGGADTYNVVGNILAALDREPWFGKLEYKIILGRFNVHVRELEEKWMQRENVHLLQNVSNMSEYMKSCDVAITAGGVTTYELCACGIPSVMYTLADNQFQIAETISQRGLIPWVGDVRYNMPECMRGIMFHLEKFMSDARQRKGISRRMQELVDGHGAERIAEHIVKLVLKTDK